MDTAATATPAVAAARLEPAVSPPPLTSAGADAAAELAAATAATAARGDSSLEQLVEEGGIAV